MQTALQDVDGAINFIVNAEKEHPNRIDICANSNNNDNGNSSSNTFGSSSNNNASPFGGPSAPANPFGSNTQSNPFGAPTTAPSGFGQPSPMGQKPNPFAPAPSNAFSQPMQTGAGAFGQPPTLGANPNPFGSPATSSSFGQPGMAPTSGFSNLGGQQSAFQQAPAVDPFGQQPQQPVASNPFGAPTSQPASSFGQTPATTNAFSPPPQPTPFNAPAVTQSPWSQAPAPAPANPFGGPPPGSVNPFGPPAGVSSPMSNPNPFGTPAQPAQSNTFGTPAQPAQANPFGTPAQPAQSNPFGNPAQPAQANPFGTPAQPAQSNPFGQPVNNVPIPPAQNAFGSQPQSISNGIASPFGAQQNGQQRAIDPAHSPYAPTATLTHPDPSSYSSRDSSGRLGMFKGKPVTYHDDEVWTRNRDGSEEKIWFPDGPPPYYSATEVDDDKYDEKTKEAYLFARENEVFRDGVMPLMPPKREWCLWDF
jgi:nucleoporin NUP42